MNWSEFPKSTFHHQEPIKPKETETELERLAKKAARTGSLRDLQAYLKARRNAR